MESPISNCVSTHWGAQFNLFTSENSLTWSTRLLLPRCTQRRCYSFLRLPRMVFAVALHSQSSTNCLRFPFRCDLRICQGARSRELGMAVPLLAETAQASADKNKFVGQKILFNIFLNLLLYSLFVSILLV